jgi:LPXTG-motif cell wall-anchored protein
MPYGIGHGLAAHNNNAIIIGIVLGALGVGLFFLQKRWFTDQSH